MASTVITQDLQELLEYCGGNFTDSINDNDVIVWVNLSPLLYDKVRSVVPANVFRFNDLNYINLDQFIERLEQIAGYKLNQPIFRN